MGLDQLMALALTEDHARQEAAWNAAPAHDRSPRRLRALIAGEGLFGAIVRFVGLDAYEAAGGGVLRDLFAEVEETPAYVVNADLMMRMATEKIQAIGQGLQDAWVAWVQSFLQCGYSERESFIETPSSRRQSNKREASTLKALQAEADVLHGELESAYDGEEFDSDETRAEIARLGQASNVVSRKINDF